MQLLKELTEAPGPPGFEEPVRKLMTDRMKPYADSITYDGLGSVIAQQGNSGSRALCSMHIMDELGVWFAAFVPMDSSLCRCSVTG